MNRSKDAESILKGKICPYCGQASVHLDSKQIYGRSYGMLYACLPCDAYVGTHRDDPSVALGRLANQTLRQLKKKAHEAFDPIWQIKMMNGVPKLEARNAAYAWLSLQLGLPRELTHIGMFDEEQCEKVIELCNNYRP